MKRFLAKHVAEFDLYRKCVILNVTRSHGLAATVKAAR